MRSYSVAIVAFLVTIPAVQAQLAIQNIQACYGPLGPERTQPQYHHMERVCIRYLVTGASTDAERQVNITTSARLTDAKGVRVANGSQTTGDFLLFGATFPDTVSFPLKRELAPGEYTLAVEVKDERTKAVASFERKLVLVGKNLDGLADEFAICSPEFFYDSEGLIPAPFSGLVNQKLYLQFNIIGISHSGGRTAVESRFEVLDAKTRQPLCKPVVKLDKTANPILGQLDLRLSSQVALHSAGDFILRVSATDQLTNKTATLEVPIRVTAP
jgi:hypothetical protein